VQVKKGISFEKAPRKPIKSTPPTKSNDVNKVKRKNDADKAVADAMQRPFTPIPKFGDNHQNPREPPRAEKDSHGNAIQKNQLQNGLQKARDNDNDLKKAEKARNTPLPQAKPAKLSPL